MLVVLDITMCSICASSEAVAIGPKLQGYSDVCYISCPVLGAGKTAISQQKVEKLLSLCSLEWPAYTPPFSRRRQTAFPSTCETSRR